MNIYLSINLLYLGGLMGKAFKTFRGSGKSLILAVNDPTFNLQQLTDLLSKAPEELGGVKVGLPYMLRYGVRQLRSVFQEYPSFYYLADLKLADLGEVMALSVNELINSGFDGVVAHAFIGVKGALDVLKKTLEDVGMDLFLQVSMPHPGSEEVIDTTYLRVKNVINGVNAEGAVVPAKKSYLIKDLKNTFPSIVILASGILRLGAQPGEGLCYGADSEVVGRAITLATNPSAMAKDVINMQRDYLVKNRHICVKG